MAQHTFDYDLIVIGSGAGGSAAATIAARSGKRVAIVERDTFGGDSPNWSDVPTNALMHAARLFDEARHGSTLVYAPQPLATTTPQFAPGKTWPLSERVLVAAVSSTKAKESAPLTVLPIS